VGISFVDVAGARGNREAEVEGVAFDTARERTEAAWEAELSRVEVAGGTDEQAAILYTSIYHALQMPTLLSDADGRYRGLDQEVHEAGDVPYYSDFSLWDTYRTLHPLLTLLWPEWQRQFLVALSRMGEEGGLVPRWPLGVAYTGSMLGDPADVVVAGSVVKGLTDFDVERTYALLQRTADGPLPEGARHGGRGCHAPYLEHGYCPADVQDGSVSWTLELGWADFALGNLAAWLGREDDAARYRARSEGWRHHVHPETGFLVGRNTDGTWVEPSEPWLPDEDLYVEGNAWHYQWLVPWDVPGLAEALGGREAMLARLDECFDKTLEVVEEAEAGGLNPKALPNPYYWHGNEPDIHAPWLYSALDRPDRTADVVRWVAGHEYGLGPEGLPGNDDAGTLAAWYVFAAVGIFPLAGDPTWWLGSPLFERVVLHLPDRDLEVRAPGASETRRYPARAWLGDRRLEVPRFDNGQLLEARVLTLEMAEEPVEW